VAGGNLRQRTGTGYALIPQKSVSESPQVTCFAQANFSQVRPGCSAAVLQRINGTSVTPQVTDKVQQLAFYCPTIHAESPAKLLGWSGLKRATLLACKLHSLPCLLG
jgi:hypothetical protein